MKILLKRSLCLLYIAFFTYNLTFAGEWTSWRGSYGDGSSKEKNLPEKWSKTENVKWKAAMPGSSYSTPVISKGKVFLTAEDEKARELYAFCVDSETGRKLWQHKVGKSRKVFNNNMSAPTPVVDGEKAYFLYGNGQCMAYDYNGKELWSRKLENDYGKFFLKFGYSTSPVLNDGILYVTLMYMDPNNEYPTEDNPSDKSFILALDAASGRTLWKHVRLTTGPFECQDAYTSPVIYKGKKGAELIILGGDCVTSHDTVSGKELWRWSGYNEKNSRVHRVITSPVIADDKIIICGPRHSFMYALKTGQKGKVSYKERFWKIDGGTDATTPLYYEGLLYVLDGDNRKLIAIDPDDGKVIWVVDLPRDTVYRASPTAGDGKIYCINEGGVVSVVKAGKTPKSLATISMGEPKCRASLAIADECLYIRTSENLYCIGK